MLYVSVVVAILMLLLANRAVYRQGRPLATTVGLLIALCVVPYFLMMLILTSVVLAFALTLLMNLWKGMNWSSKSFTATSILSCLLMFAGCSQSAFQDIEELRQLHKLVSLEDRLPARSVKEQPLLTELAKFQLTRLDDHYERQINTSSMFSRTVAFRDLHQKAFDFFVMSPRFGIARMPSAYRRLTERDNYAPEDPTPRQSKPIDLPWSISDVESQPLPRFMSFENWLRFSITQFVPLNSLGYASDRKHTSGFLPHGQYDYARAPTDYEMTGSEKYERFKVERLDLVSLLLHESAVAYDSDTLPAMDKVKELKTRPLNAFEVIGLLKLHKGDDLFARGFNGKTLLLGALRNAKECKACHEGNYGDLLGAFSYVLQPRQ
jgi:hypothetical protein